MAYHASNETKGGLTKLNPGSRTICEKKHINVAVRPSSCHMLQYMSI